MVTVQVKAIDRKGNILGTWNHMPEGQTSSSTAQIQESIGAVWQLLREEERKDVVRFETTREA